MTRYYLDTNTLIFMLFSRRDLDSAVTDILDNLGIRIIHTTDHHLRQLHQLPLYSDHRDPFDRLIIAQAIVDRIPIITSDRRFDLYLDSNLQLQFNQR